MRKSTTLAAVLVLCASAALAQQPQIKIIGPSEADVGTPVFLILDGLSPEDAKLVNWGLFPQSDDVQFIQLFDAQGRPLSFFWSKTPGRYCVFLDINVPGNFCLILHELQYGEPEPVPPPPPPPPGELWGIVVEESRDRTPEQGIVLASPKVRALFADGEFRVLDDDTPVGADLQPYLDRAKAMELPALFLVDEAGTVYFEGPLPGTVAEMEALVGKYGGK